MIVQGFWYGGRFFPIIAGGAEGDPPASDGDGGSGGTPPGGTPPANGGSASGAGDQSIVFSNSRQLGQRLGRERKEALDGLATKYGFASQEEMEAALGQTKERRDRDQGEATTLRQQLQQAQSQLSERDATISRMALRHAVEAEASTMGFHSPEDAFAMADFSQVSVTDGAADRAAIKTQLTQLGKAKPYLLKQPLGDGQSDQQQQQQQKPPPPNGASGGQQGGDVQRGMERGVMINGIPVTPRAPIPTRQSTDVGQRFTEERRAEIAQRFPFLQQRRVNSGGPRPSGHQP